MALFWTSGIPRLASRRIHGPPSSLGRSIVKGTVITTWSAVTVSLVPPPADGDGEGPVGPLGDRLDRGARFDHVAQTLGQGSRDRVVAGAHMEALVAVAEDT